MRKIARNIHDIVRISPTTVITGFKILSTSRPLLNAMLAKRIVNNGEINPLIDPPKKAIRNITNGLIPLIS